MKVLVTKKAILKSDELHASKETACVLTISVGQPNHEGDKLLATILAANKNFSSCIIMVCDSLQRHTMSIDANLSFKTLHADSNKLGAEWIERNLPAIHHFKIPYKISQWDDWLAHNDFIVKQDLITALYKNDLLFRKSIDETVAEFVSRKAKHTTFNINVARKYSCDYLLEECAVMLLLADCGYAFEIYPSQRNAAMSYVYQAIIAVNRPDLMRAVSIKFKNINNGGQTQSLNFSIYTAI